jgi:hypothetical protein
MKIDDKRSAIHEKMSEIRIKDIDNLSEIGTFTLFFQSWISKSIKGCSKT